MRRLKPKISEPGTGGYGPGSPVQQALNWLERFFGESPRSDIDTDRSSANAALIATHLLHLLRGAGLLNGTGFHSAAISLFRPMEDALDCFAAAALVNGAAEAWETGQLKPCEAAKQWTSLATDMSPQHLSLPDYRKYLRRDFNVYSHCSNEVCTWNLFFHPQSRDERTGKLRGTLQLNIRAKIIDRNAHAVDAFETAHILEFIQIVRPAYSKLLQSRRDLRTELDVVEAGVVAIMEKHDEHHCQEVRVAPEIAQLNR